MPLNSRVRICICYSLAIVFEMIAKECLNPAVYRSFRAPCLKGLARFPKYYPQALQLENFDAEN